METDYTVDIRGVHKPLKTLISKQKKNLELELLKMHKFEIRLILNLIYQFLVCV